MQILERYLGSNVASDIVKIYYGTEEVYPTGINIEAGSGSLIITAFMPSMGVEIPLNVNDLTFEGFAGVGEISSFSDLGSVTIEGFASVLKVDIITGVGGSFLAGIAPSLNVSSAPNSGSLVLSGFTPTSNLDSTTDVGSFNANGLAPSSTVSAPVGVGSSLFNGFNVGVTTLTEVDTLLSQASTDGYTAPSGDNLTALNEFISDLKTSGAWAKIDACWLFASGGDENFARYNLKDPTSHNITNNGSTWTSLEGFDGDGLSDYLDTNFNLSTHGSNFVQNSASMGFYSRDTLVGTHQMGAKDANSNTQSKIRASGAAPRNNLNGTNFQNSVAKNDAGFYHINRSASNAVQLNHNGVQYDSHTDASGGVCSANMFIMARNNNGVATSFHPGQMAFSFIGGDLSSEKLSLYNAIQDYMTAVGTEV